jgi:multidrug transporter EmrE-like cation transporter
LQKQAHNDVKSTDEFFLTKCSWWVGMVLVLLAQPMYLVAVTMTKLSILGVIGPFSIIANILLARFFLKERIKLQEYIGISLFIPGTILTLLYAKMENHRYNRIQFNELFYSSLSMSYLITSVTLMIILLICSYYILELYPYSDIEDYQSNINIELSESLANNPTLTDSTSPKEINFKLTLKMTLLAI